MPLNTCPICRNEIVGELCGFHTRGSEVATWAQGNKIWCDIIHRQVFPKQRIEKGVEG